MKKILFIALSAVLLTTGCGDLTLSGTTSIGGGNNNNNNGGNTGNKVESINVDKTYIELDLQDNKTAQINVNILPSTANQTVLFTSEDTSIATIDEKGLITAISKGTVNIIVLSQANPAIFKNVTVVVSNGNDTPVIDKVLAIELQIAKYTLDINPDLSLTSAKINYIVKPDTIAEDKKGVTFSVKDNTIVSVDDNGNITALKAGSTEIILTSTNNPEATATVYVEVLDTTGEKITPVMTANPSNITLTVNNNVALTSKVAFSYYPKIEGSYVLSCTSFDNSTVKCINTNGNPTLVPHKEGNVTIKAKAVFFGESPYPEEISSNINVNVISNTANIPQHPDISPSNPENYPDRMYLKIQFDMKSSTGDLYDSNTQVGITGTDFQNDAQTCDGGVCSGDLIEGGQGYINPFGYCEKYGCAGLGSVEAADIAKKNVGINYYVANDKLFVPVPANLSGTQRYKIWIIFSRQSENYIRPNIYFPINWSEYKPSIHKNIAKFHIQVTDKKETVTFMGFESK